MLNKFMPCMAAYITLLSLWLLYPGESPADVIVLENNDRLSGTVTRIDSGVLTLVTEYSEPIKVRTEKIKKIITDKPVELHLENGEILKGSIKTTGDGRIMVESSSDREYVFIDWGKVKALNPPPGKWNGSITLGANLQSGNTDRVSATIGADSTRRTEKDRVSLRFLFNYAKEDDNLTARNTYGALKYDYFLTKKMYAYLGVEMLSDEFKDLQLRTVVGPGIGYQIWDEPDKSLFLEAGMAYFSENFEEGEDDHWFTARLASNLRWKIFGPIIFTDYMVIYPSLTDFGEFQLRNETALLSPILSGWSLKLANILEHDSSPSPGVKKSDFYWILGLQYDF